MFTEVVVGSVTWRWRPYGAQSHPWHRCAALRPCYLAHCSTSRKLRWSVCRLRPARGSHNVGQCACLHKMMYGEKKKKKKRHHRAELSSRCLVSHDWKEMLRLAECRGKHSAVILFHYLLARTVTQLYLQDACWHLRVNLVFSEVSYCLIRSWHGVLYFHTSLNIGLNMAALASAVAPWAAAESKGNCGISRK